MTYPIILETELECDDLIIDSELCSDSLELESVLDINEQTLNHSLLSHRTDLNSHPIRAITGLTEKLVEFPDTPISNSEILNM